MSNNIPKIHPKHLTWLMPLMLSGIMSGSISCFNLLLNKGLVDGFFGIWLHACMEPVMDDGLSIDFDRFAFGA